jgi:molecular chaperone HscB
MKTCTNCNNSHLSNLFCDGCGKVQEIKLENGVSVFGLFGFRPSLDIDKKILDKKYSELVKLMHPDRFVFSTEDDKLIAETNIAIINKAYSILSSEVSLCEYILNNIKEVNNEEIINDEDEFLSKKMDLYDELGSLNSLGKCINFKNKLVALYRGNLCDLRNNIGKQSWSNANKALQRIKFIQNLLEALEKKAYVLEVEEKLHKK